MKSKKVSVQSARSAEPVISMIGRVSTASVFKHTGRHWDEWISILDSSGARNWEHPVIVDFLVRKYKLTPWWRQGVATGYEMHLGKKVEGRNAKGEYTTAASKTFPFSAKKLWDFLDSKEGQAIWLKPLSDFQFQVGRVFENEDGVFGSVRTMKKPERVRMRWQDTDWEKPSVLNLYFASHKPGRCILVFQQDAIKDAREKNKLKDHWKNVLENLFIAISAA